MSVFRRFWRKWCCVTENNEDADDLADARSIADVCDEIFVRRVYKSSSVILAVNQDVIFDHPNVPKISKSELFDDKEVVTTCNKTRKQKNRRLAEPQDMSAKDDLGGDTGDVAFNDSDVMDALGSF
ncbi:hypothetical protein ACF0H5_011612 [Mactra antiquata]